jgi:hypothetical protein
LPCASHRLSSSANGDEAFPEAVHRTNRKVLNHHAPRIVDTLFWGNRTLFGLGWLILKDEGQNQYTSANLLSDFYRFACWVDIVRHFWRGGICDQL